MSRPLPQKNICWNGIEYAVPVEWEAVVTGKQQVLLQHDLEPLIELKWHKDHAKSIDQAHDRVVKQLSREFGKPDTTEIVADKTIHHELIRFTWKQSKLSVFLLFCPVCRTTVLARPYDISFSATQIAKTLRCHQNTQKIKWAVQDFSFTLPESYSLESFSFTMGFTRISFLEKKNSLHLCRMIPASTHLEASSLEHLLRKLAGHESTKMSINTTRNYVELWSEPSLLRQLRIRMKRHKPFVYGRLWHHQASDKLLGFTIEGIAPASTSMIEQIYNDHEASIS